MEMPPEFGAKLSKRQQYIYNELGKSYTMIGMLVMRADQYDGMVIVSQAEKLSESAVNVLRHHRQAEKWVYDFLQSNDYITFASLYGGVIFAILQHHNMVPDVRQLVAKAFKRQVPHANTEQPPVSGNNQGPVPYVAENQLATG